MILDVGAFKPTKCIVTGCRTTRIFPSGSQLRWHLRDKHDMSKTESEEAVPIRGNARMARPKLEDPQDSTPAAEVKCPIDGCQTREKFPRPSTLKAHLKSPKHKISDEEATALTEQTFGKKMREYNGPKAREKQTTIPLPCPANSDHKTTFTSMSGMRDHLIGADNMEPAAAIKLTETTFGKTSVYREPTK